MRQDALKIVDCCGIILLTVIANLSLEVSSITEMADTLPTKKRREGAMDVQLFERNAKVCQAAASVRTGAGIFAGTWVSGWGAGSMSKRCCCAGSHRN